MFPVNVKVPVFDTVRDKLPTVSLITPLNVPVPMVTVSLALALTISMLPEPEMPLSVGLKVAKSRVPLIAVMLPLETPVNEPYFNVVPTLIVVAPVYVLAPASVSTPVPACVTEPVPLMALLRVMGLVKLNVKPALSTIPLVPMEPDEPPLPICKMPPVMLVPPEYVLLLLVSIRVPLDWRSEPDPVID